MYRKSGALSSTDELEKADHYHQLALEIRKERLTSNKADVSASYCNIGMLHIDCILLKIFNVLSSAQLWCFDPNERILYL